MENPNIQMLFVEYQFLGCPLQETEAPFSLPKPKPGGQITFNFNKGQLTHPRQPDMSEHKLHYEFDACHHMYGTDVPLL